MDPSATESTDDAEGTDSYVVFQLEGEGYALEVARVREVLDVAALTRVPGASRSLCGLYNLRGQVVPVWNLRVPFGLQGDPAPGRAPGVLMVEHRAEGEGAGRLAGLMVDRVYDVLDFHPGDIQPAPTLGLGGGSPFVRGLIRHQERFLLLLDLDRVFATLGTEDATEHAGS